VLPRPLRGSLEVIPDWIGEHESMLWWIGVVGLVTLLLTAVAIPFVVARIPSDYLVNDQAEHERGASANTALRILLLVLKNLVGWVLILVGLAMLITPGQGLLSIFVGLTLINFPGKRRLLRSLLRRPSIHRAANWIRARCGVAPLELPH
jgi:hypothetical protein